jgi:hypothetical protein
MTGTRSLPFLGLLLAAATFSATEPLDADPVSGTWSRIAPPVHRASHSAIYDPVRDRVIVFGGNDTSTPFNDVWVLTNGAESRWTHITPLGTPPPTRGGHVAIYDPVRDRMLIWGGKKVLSSAPRMDDLWELKLSGTPEWAEIPQGVRPEARWGARAIYDPVRDRMVLFGGADTTVGGYLGDTWALDLSGAPTWSLLSPGGGPTPRRNHGAAYDPAGDRMIVFGGHDGAFRNDLWAMDLSGPGVWDPLAAVGTPPTPCEAPSLVYDPAGTRLLLMGGMENNVAPPVLSDDLWELRLSGPPEWAQLSPGGPLPAGRYSHATVLDPADGTMVVFAGFGAGVRNDAWRLSLQPSLEWEALEPVGSYPGFRRSHHSIYDATRQRMVVIASIGPSVLEHSLALSGLPVWSEISAGGPSPPARDWPTAVHDPLRDRILLVGGYPGPPEVWALSLSQPPTWSQILPAGPIPPQMESVVAIYDPIRDRVVFHYAYGAPNDLWTLELNGMPTWVQLTPAGQAPPGTRLGHSAIYDALRDRMVIFGGNSPPSGARSDVWALSLSSPPAWTEIVPPVAISPGRVYHTAVYDPLRDRMVVHAGGTNISTNNVLNELWELSLAAPNAWTMLALGPDAPVARTQHTSIYDSAWDRMIVYGGIRGGITYGDIWELRWNETAGTPVGGPSTGLGFHAIRVQPGGAVIVTFTLPAVSAARLMVVDVTGRRLLDREITGREGTQTIHLGETATLPSGIYFLRLTQGAAAATARAAVIH